MLGPGDFVLIVAVVFAGAALLVVAAGALHSRELGSLPRAKPRRDRIADGTIKPPDVDAMYAAENARLRAQGRTELTRSQVESRLVGDGRFRRRLALLRRRRRPERAGPVA
jgi:hypothetical protein